MLYSLYLFSICADYYLIRKSSRPTPIVFFCFGFCEEQAKTKQTNSNSSQQFGGGVLHVKNLH